MTLCPLGLSFVFFLRDKQAHFRVMGGKGQVKFSVSLIFFLFSFLNSQELVWVVFLVLIYVERVWQRPVLEKTFWDCSIVGDSLGMTSPICCATQGISLCVSFYFPATSSFAAIICVLWVMEVFLWGGFTVAHHSAVQGLPDLDHFC